MFFHYNGLNICFLISGKSALDMLLSDYHLRDIDVFLERYEFTMYLFLHWIENNKSTLNLPILIKKFLLHYFRFAFSSDEFVCHCNLLLTCKGMRAHDYPIQPRDDNTKVGIHLLERELIHRMCVTTEICRLQMVLSHLLKTFIPLQKDLR